MTTELVEETQKPAHGKNQAKGRRANKPASAWLAALISPHSALLRRKAWLDVVASLMSIPTALCLTFAINALFVEKAGVAGMVPFAVAMIVAIAVRSGLSFWSGRLGHGAAARVKHNVRLRLAYELAHQSPLDIERHSAGEIAALGSDVVESLEPYIARYLSLPLQLMVVPAVILIVTAYLSWALALLLLACGALIPVVMALVGIRAKKASDQQVAALSDMSARFLDRLSGMTTLRLFRAVGRTRDEFASLADDYRQATMRVLRIAFLSSAALELFSAVGIALSAIYVAYQILGTLSFGSYGAPLSLGSGLFLLMLVPEFFAPLREFAAAYHDKASAEAGADRLRQLLPQETLGDEIPLQGADSQFAISSAQAAIQFIRFERCDLGYDNDRGAILKDVSFECKAGQSLAILGPSGAGKSTLLAALCGFIQPSAGTLYFDDSPAPTDNTGWSKLRSAMSWIGQRPHIFHGSLLMNARLARPEADRAEVQAALEQAHADLFVAQLPRDVLTILGETGFGISGGQIRRLAMARAALSNASLVLCDEPTADLDADTAALITDSLMSMAQDRILVIATHDKAVAQRCDHVLSVKDGRVGPLHKDQLDALALSTSPSLEAGGPS